MNEAAPWSLVENAKSLRSNGHLTDAVAVLDNALALHAGFTPALAWKTIILSELGLTSALEPLIHNDLIQQFSIDDLALPSAVSSEVHRLLNHVLWRDLQSPPSSMPIHSGRKTRDIVEKYSKADGDEPIVAVSEAAWSYYLNKDPLHPSNPLRHSLEHVQLAAWGMVLESGGTVGAHYHPFSLLSAVLYIHTEINAGGELSFGRPMDEVRSKEPIFRRLITPRNYSLVVFPSYLFHEVLRFTGRTRVSIAFDLKRRSADTAIDIA